MALFGGIRDIKLFNSLTRELMYTWVDTLVDVYKASVPDTRVNLYGEATHKVNLTAIRVPALISHGDQAFPDTEFGFDVSQETTFAFAKEILRNTADLVLEVGDIVNWNESYYEIDSVVENQLFMDKNPDTTKESNEYSRDVVNKFGSSISIICAGHLTRRSALSIERTNVGNPGLYG
tara:strand:- start:705 stop:1238 length:534 start_codon:yes stop_codon:yes gene_type:complete